MMPSRLGSLAVCHNHVSGANVSVNYLHYGADVQIDPGMLGDFYLLQVPLSGSAFVRHRGTDIVASCDTATLLNPDRETQMQWHGDCRKLLLQIKKGFLQSVAEDLIGAPVPGTIRFDPVVNLTRAMAVEWAQENVRVNALAPTWVRTDFIAPLLEDAALVEQMESLMPMRRLAEPEDIAGAAMFLLSTASAMVTGHTLAVDGGFLAQ